MFHPGLSKTAFRTRKPPRAARPAWKRAEDYKRWLRKLPCACGGGNDFCYGPTEAAHVDLAGKGSLDAKGLGTKVSDRFCMPLSAGCHHQQTAIIGWPMFEQTLPTRSSVALSNAYWHEWPGRIAWEREQRQVGL